MAKYADVYKVFVNAPRGNILILWILSAAGLTRKQINCFPFQLVNFRLMAKILSQCMRVAIISVKWGW